MNKQERSHTTRYSRLMLRYFLLVLFTISGIFYIAAPEKASKIFVISNLIVATTATVVFTLYFRSATGRFQYISIAILFLFSFVVVHFQLPLLYSFGYYLQSGYIEYFLWGDENIICRSTSLSTLALCSYYVGYSWSSIVKMKRLSEKPIRPKWYPSKSSISFLVLGSFLFYILFYSTSGSYKFGLYAAGDHLIISNYFATFCNSCLTAALILKLYVISSENGEKIGVRKYMAQFGNWLNFIVFWHILFSVFVGDRGPVITYLLLYFSLYIIRFIRIRLVLVVAGIAVFSVLLNIVGAARSRSSELSYSDRVSEASGQASGRFKNQFVDSDVPLASTMELAFSMRCLNHSMSNVPSKEPFAFGNFQMLQIVAAVPGLSYLYHNIVNDGKFKYGGSANFITELVQGKNYTYGEGTAPTADLYLDFGGPGVLLGFLFFGLFTRKADYAIQSGNTLSLVLWIASLIYFSGAIYLGRATLLYYFQKVLHVYFLVWLSKQFGKK